MGRTLADAIHEKLPQLELRENEPLANHTSFRIGGPAKAVLFPKSTDELRRLCGLLRSLGEKPLLLGNGSNVLAPDAGTDRAVILTVKICGMSRLGDGLKAECGAALTRLAAFAAAEGLGGLEFAYGIPGTVGGALVMNAGAYGGEMKDVVLRTVFLDGELRERKYEGEDHLFGYRTSAFKDGEVILETEMRLHKAEAEKIREKMEELMARRRSSQPVELPSAGSAFKRPANGYAAELIDRCGLKGFTVGGAGVSEKHAGFIVNNGGATADDVKKVIEHVRETVYERTGTELCPEIRIIDG